jgi:hypothetical protein
LFALEFPESSARALLVHVLYRDNKLHSNIILSGLCTMV